MKANKKIEVFKDKGIFTYGDKTMVGYYEKGNWIYYDQFLNDYVNCLIPISPDTFWISTFRGLLKYQNGEILLYNSANSPLPNNSLYALAMDKKGVIWGSFGYQASTVPGIFSFNGTNWQIWTSVEVPYLTYNATSITFDSQNHLWCNSLNQGYMNSCKGLIRYDGNNWSLYDQSNSPLPSNTIYSIYADNHDTLWVATSYGAAKFDRQNKWEVFTLQNSGLAFHSIQDVVRLPNGNVYFSHNYGGLSVLKNANIINKSSSVSKADEIKTYPTPAHDILYIQIPNDCNLKHVGI